MSPCSRPSPRVGVSVRDLSECRKRLFCRVVPVAENVGGVPPSLRPQLRLNLGRYYPLPCQRGDTVSVVAELSEDGHAVGAPLNLGIARAGYDCGIAQTSSFCSARRCRRLPDTLQPSATTARSTAATTSRRPGGASTMGSRRNP